MSALDPTKYLTHMEVTCVGANAPGILLLNLVMIFFLIVVFESDINVFMFTTMPALFEGSLLGKALSALIEPSFRSFVQILLANVNISIFFPLYQNPSVTDDTLDDNLVNKGVIFEERHAQMRSKLCDSLSNNGETDTTIAILTITAAYLLLVPIFHLLVHTVRARPARAHVTAQS